VRLAAGALPVVAAGHLHHQDGQLGPPRRWLEQ
jgi:hypothetical protein